MHVSRPFVFGALLLFLPVVVRAQIAPVEPVDDLPARLAEIPDPTSPPKLDTALVVTNLRRAAAKVYLVGYDRAGNPVGRVEREVPGHGLVYVFASELTGARRFLGKVEGVGRGRLTASAVLIGGAVTDLPAISKTRRIGVCAEDEMDANVTVETVITYPVAAAIR